MKSLFNRFKYDLLFWGIVFAAIVVLVTWSRGCAVKSGPDYNTIGHEYPSLEGKDSAIGGRTKGDEVLDVDLPGKLHIKNIGSKVDGAGMCVMSSIEMAARVQNMDPRWQGLRDWCANDPGGAYPQKVVEQLDAYAKSKGIPNVRDSYIQYEGPDPWPIIEAALKSGRCPCITYGYSPRYGKEIAHMVCAVKGADGKYGVVLDNNFPGEENYEWMDIPELKRRVNYPNRSGWVFVWLAPPPPPSPRNPK